jgi:hypothetical protein
MYIGNGKINTNVVKIYNFFRKALIIIQNLMVLVVFIDKSDRFTDLPYTAVHVMKMASGQEQFRPNQIQSMISTKIMAKTLTNNEKTAR